MAKKDPAATLDWSYDWSRWLDTDEIASATWVVPDGLTKASESNTTTVATVWISGGTLGTDHRVTCRVVTTGGRTDERSFPLSIRDR